MPRFKLCLDRETCIGSFACVAAAPQIWQQAADNKVTLLGSMYNPQTRKFELIIEADSEQAARDSAEVCPVLAITVEEITAPGCL